MSEIFLAGVMGYPIEHSLSPEIFDFISRRLGIPLVYKKLAVPAEDLQSTVEVFKKLSLLTGWNVTIPHKKKIVELMDLLSPEARAISAVNVVQVQKNRLLGYNTDVLGVSETFRENAILVRDHSALIFGAGGAALSVGYVLGDQGAADVALVNRSHDSGEAAVRTLSGVFPKTRFHSLPWSAVESFDSPRALYVNATPLGMQGYGASGFHLPRKVTPEAVAFDLIYRPEHTPFLSEMGERGLKTVGGLDMLIWQAIAAWEIWMHPISNEKDFKSTLKTELKAHLRQILVKS
jgi:shikimate dehydrogenase